MSWRLMKAQRMAADQPPRPIHVSMPGLMLITFSWLELPCASFVKPNVPIVGFLGFSLVAVGILRQL